MAFIFLHRRPPVLIQVLPSILEFLLSGGQILRIGSAGVSHSGCG